MPSALRLIEESARAAWHQALAIQRAARADSSTSSADLDALADYADEQRDRWFRANERTRRDEDRRRVDATLAALDHGADEFDFSTCDWADDFGPTGPGDDDFGPASPDDDFGFDVPGDR